MHRGGDTDGSQWLFDMGDRVRLQMSLPDKLKELAIVITARYWGAQFEWLAHRRAAVQAGASEGKVKAVPEGRRPAGRSAAEEAGYKFITEPFTTWSGDHAPVSALHITARHRPPPRLCAPTPP